MPGSTILGFSLPTNWQSACRSNQGSAVKEKGNEKYAKAIDHALGLTVAFQRDNALGVYGKARLFNAFKWQLKRLGYPDDFVDTATAALVNLAANVRAAK
jgi:hypothetical protein